MLTIRISVNNDKEIATGTIHNITNLAQISDYETRFSATTLEGSSRYYEGNVEDFDRDHDAWFLLYQALRNIFESGRYHNTVKVAKTL